MAELAITTEIINKMMAGSYGSESDSRESVLRRTFDALKSAGAERVRVYQFAAETLPELPTHPLAMYLTWTSYDAEKSGHWLGYRIPLETATINRSLIDGTRDPVAAHPDPVGGPNWVHELGLDGRSWIDVLVRDRSKDVGVLAFDWKGAPKKLTTEELSILRLTGQLLGFQLAATSPTMERQLQDKMLAIYSRGRQNVFPLQDALRAFQRECDIASLSLFRYEWTNQRLVRQSLFINGSANAAEAFEDETFELDDRLTGKAFHSAEHRRVLDFTVVEEFAPQLISQPSANFHSGALGSVKTVMHAVLGVEEPKYLVRAINHREHPSLPFISEAELLESFAKDLSPFLDGQLARTRSDAVQRMQDLATVGAPLLALCEQAQESLNSVEDIQRIVVIIGREGSAAVKPHFLMGVRDTDGTMREAIAKDPVWTDIVSKQRTLFDVLRRQDSKAIGRAARITSRDNVDVAVLPIHSGGTVGMLVFPVGGGAWARHRRGKMMGVRSSAFITQIASMIAQRADQEYVTAQAQGAQQALSLVGHEMTEPLSATKQLAERAMSLAAAAVSGREDVEVNAAIIEDLRVRLRRHVENLGAAVQLGHLVGRQIDRHIIGERSRVAIQSLMNYAITRVNREMNFNLLQVPTGSVRITKPVGGSGAYLNCDSSLVEVAILNILRNAVKYSSQSTGAVSEVSTRISRNEIGGSHLEIAISNIGVEIPPLARSLIFDAFTRFTEGDEDGNRRGMGLGLYLAQRIAAAHAGDVLLSQERTDLESSSGTKLWRTTFTLRVRSDLPVGPYRSTEGGTG